MNAVGATTEETPKRHTTEGEFVMAARGMRSAVARFVVVAGLAVALFVGSLTLGGAQDTSAMPKYSCAQAIKLVEINLATGNVFYALGNYQTASFYYGKAQAYADFC